MRYLSYIVGLALCAYGVLRAAILLRDTGPEALLPLALASPEPPLALLLFSVGVLFLAVPGRGGAIVDSDPRIPALRQEIEEVRAEVGKLDRAAPRDDAELKTVAAAVAALADRLDDLSTGQETPPAAEPAAPAWSPPPAEPAPPHPDPDLEPLLLEPSEPAPATPLRPESLARSLSEFERLLLDAMIVMIGMDGALEDSEVTRTCEAYLAITGHAVEPATVRALARMMADESEGMETLLSRAAQDLDADQRRGVIEGAYVVSVADHDLHPDEMAAMHRLGAAMGLGLDEVHRIIDDCIAKY